MLYKISNLEYSIRLKEIEYNDALSRNDHFQLNVHGAALSYLKEDLAKTVQEFNTADTAPVAEVAPVVKKTAWWKVFFPGKIITNKKA